jgi:hypothetical protein
LFTKVIFEKHRGDPEVGALVALVSVEAVNVLGGAVALESILVGAAVAFPSSLVVVVVLFDAFDVVLKMLLPFTLVGETVADPVALLLVLAMVREVSFAAVGATVLTCACTLLAHRTTKMREDTFILAMRLPTAEAKSRRVQVNR